MTTPNSTQWLFWLPIAVLSLFTIVRNWQLMAHPDGTVSRDMQPSLTTKDNIFHRPMDRYVGPWS